MDWKLAPDGKTYRLRLVNGRIVAELYRCSDGVWAVGMAVLGGGAVEHKRLRTGLTEKGAQRVAVQCLKTWLRKRQKELAQDREKLVVAISEVSECLAGFGDVRTGR